MTSKVHHSVVADAPIFAGMSGADLDALIGLATSRHYSSGSAVFEQGEPAEHFYVLVSGRLRVSQVNGEGQQTIVHMVNPGEIFGMARMLRRHDYPGTASAVADSVVLAWPAASWETIMTQHPLLAANVMGTIGERLQEAHARVRELSTEEVERRVAHTVLRLAGQAGKKEPAGIRIDFPISKQDLAEMTGTTLHTVSRILSAWEKAGLVEGGRQRLLLKEPHQLLLIGDGHRPGLL
jgi:CRP-like cAMP-binding protein